LEVDGTNTASDAPPAEAKEPHFAGAPLEVTRKVHEVGSVRIVKAGTAYGPLRVGESGCTVVDIFAAGPQGITFVGRDPSGHG
jgi:hypothetical protein